MFFRVVFGVLFVSAALCGAETALPLMTKDTLIAAVIESRTDGIGSGWCGRGMLSILKTAGLARGLEGANGQDWERSLMKAGWKYVTCSSPTKAPLGSVLVYSNDIRLGKLSRGTGGGSYGHVEMVALSPEGYRLYVSDSARPMPGGTVRDNFTKRAWLPPGRQIWATPPIDVQVAEVLQERKRMAMDYFDKKTSAIQTAQLILPSQ